MGEFLVLMAAEAAGTEAALFAAESAALAGTGAIAGESAALMSSVAGASAVAGSPILGSLSFGNVLSGFGALSALSGGARGQAAAEFEAAQFREEQENARVAAMQEEVQRRRQLQRTLSSINAIRAGRGVEMFDGGSGEAIRRQVISEGEEDINTMKINYLNRARRFGLAAEESTLKGQSAMLGGVGTAAQIMGKNFARD